MFGIMRKIHILPIFVILAFVISSSVPQVYALPSITVTPTSGPVSSIITVSGKGFISEEKNTVYVFFDNKRVDSVSVASDGSFSIRFPVPIATLGLHTISISDSPIRTGGVFLLASTHFTVISASITHTAIPEFPFSFSLVIIFVAVTAVYLVIRQKMTVNLKPF